MSSNQNFSEHKIIPPPASTPQAPDTFTKKSPGFMDGDADGQIFHFAKFGIRYGTDDKGHAAALILSCVLLFCAMIVSSLGLFVSFSSKDPKWIEIVLTWIGNAFLFTAGIAVGKGKGEKSN